MATFGPFTDNQRTEHLEAGRTVFRTLLSKGFTETQIAAAVEREVAMQEIGLGYLAKTDNDEDPAIGITYCGDYKHEEERGSELISKALQNFSNQKRLVAIDVEQGVATVSISYSPVVRDDASYQRTRLTARLRHRSPYNSTFHLRHLKVADLRTALKAAKVSPLPRKRDSLELSYLENVEGKAVQKSVSVGEFQRGNVLVIVTDEPILVTALEALAVAAEGNALALGSSANPFSNGILFYDVRDVANTLVEKTRLAEEWTASKMNLAGDAIEKLEDAGTLYAIHPSEFTGTVVGRPHSGNGGVFYFINYSPRRGDQLHGWMTIEDLYLIADGTLTNSDIEDRQKAFDDWYHAN